jgi:DedD protein
MLVLVGVGMVVFPTFLETQPRPVARDVAVRVAGVTPESAIPSAGPLTAGGQVVPAAPPAGPVGPAVLPESLPSPEPAAATEPTQTATPQPVARLEEAPPSTVNAPSVSASVATPKPAPKPEPQAAPQPAPKAEPKPKPKPKPEPKPEPKAAAKVEAKPAAKPAEPTSNERFVVQFGAFADPQSAREARQKLERLGIKTYAQEVDTSAGKRTRVRMGPYTSRSEAEKALAALRKAGLDGKVLTL